MNDLGMAIDIALAAWCLWLSVEVCRLKWRKR